MKKRVTVPFFIPHHGCPHRCVFCDQVSISGAEEAIPSPEEIRATVARYRSSSSQPSVDVAFFGGTFTMLSETVQDCLLAPLQDMVGAGIVDGIRISTRPDAVDLERCEFLLKRKVTIVELGAQSLDEGVLGKAERGHSVLHVRSAVRLLREKGFLVGLQLMLGLPGDDGTAHRASMAHALELRPDFLRLYPTLVIAGTRLEELYRLGEYEPLTLDRAVELCCESLRMTHRAGIPVIRTGLQPTEELSAAGCVVAGPYHPSFGQLVRNRLCYDLLSSLASGERQITVRCAPGSVSDVVGQRRSTLNRLLSEQGVAVVVKSDPLLGPLELEVTTSLGIRRGHIMAGASDLPEVA